MVLVVIIVLLIMMLCDQTRKAKRIERSIRTYNAMAEFWKDRYNRAHAETEVVRMQFNDLKNAYPQLIEDAKKNFTGLKPKTITKITYIDKVTRDTIFLDQPHACPELNFYYTDGWNSFLHTSTMFTFEVKDSIAMVQSTKRYGFLNLKKRETVEVISFNPKTSFTGAKSITIDRPPSRVGIGVMIGYGATSSGLSPTISAGLFYRVF